MSTQPAGSTRVRTSDAEREEVVSILRAAMGEGRLTLDEGEERIATAYAAKFRDELAPLTTDLPEGGRPALFNIPEVRARAIAHGRRRLARHAVFIGVLAGVLTGLWALSGARFFWPVIPLAFFAIGWLKHAAWHRHGGWRRPGHWRRYDRLAR